jgi:hypothetical protein
MAFVSAMASARTAADDFASLTPEDHGRFVLLAGGWFSMLVLMLLCDRTDAVLLLTTK